MAVASAASADAAGPQRPVYSPDEVLEQLRAIPAESRSHAARGLLASLELQHELVRFLASAAQQEQVPAEATMALFDRRLLQFLENIYSVASALPGALRYDALQVQSGPVQLAGRAAEGRPATGLGEDTGRVALAFP